jgi:mono/diheme cytochrome c family protein
MYERFCVVCHGAEGNSMQAPILDKLQMMAAFNLASGGAVFRTDGYIYGMIRVGRGIMPQYGHQMSHYDRWHIVNYIRSFQPATAPGGEN